MGTHTHTHTHTHRHTVCACVCVCMCVHVYTIPEMVHVCVHVCVCACVCVNLRTDIIGRNQICTSCRWVFNGNTWVRTIKLCTKTGNMTGFKHWNYAHLIKLNSFNYFVELNTECTYLAQRCTETQQRPLNSV